MSKKRILLVPYWVQEILNRNQLPLSAVLDFGKLQKLMSLNDLIGLAALQGFVSMVGMTPDMDELYWTWLDRISDVETRRYCSDNVLALANDKSFKDDLLVRLFSAESKSDQYKEPFITYDLTQDVGAVVLYPGYFSEETPAELQVKLIDALLKLCYVYEPYHEVAKTPLFKRYLDLLSGKHPCSI